MSEGDKNKDDEIFTDAEKGPDNLITKSIKKEPKNINIKEIKDNHVLKINGDVDIKEIRENISKNSLEIADLKNLTESIDYGNIPSNHTDDSNVSTPRRVRYIYANVFDEGLDDSNEWTDIKRYRFQKCLWKLKYNRIVSSFYLNNLRNSEHKWSWMIIVISTMTSGLTVANNVDESNAPIENYNTYVNVLLTVSSMSTSLIAAWIKKQMFIEKINEIDKYLYELNSLCEELEIQLSLLNTDRLKYDEFKKIYIPKMTQYLTTNPIIPPLEWKRCIREITLDYPELLNMDDSEDNKLWPWYGDLISDPKNDDENAPHVRYKTNFYRKFKKTKKDKYLSTCCGKKKMEIVYDCENNNP